MTHSVDEIVRSLTKGQRAVLLETIPGASRQYEAAPGIPRISLFTKGLIQFCGQPTDARFQITPLGEQVRAALIKERTS